MDMTGMEKMFGDPVKLKCIINIYMKYYSFHSYHLYIHYTKKIPFGDYFLKQMYAIINSNNTNTPKIAIKV